MLGSHVSAPMLAHVPFQHPGESWITALGVILAAAGLTCGMVAGAEQGAAYVAHRRGRRAANEVARRLGVAAPPGAVIPDDLLAAASVRPALGSARARGGRARPRPGHGPPAGLTRVPRGRRVSGRRGTMRSPRVPARGNGPGRRREGAVGSRRTV
ncbi:MAG TPA: hypothetical protein VNN74_00015 [Candidatus Micrarchaeia archaeon]|nr:hypothetical protein [Candidatus Micrarchaeia archaeon]